MCVAARAHTRLCVCVWEVPSAAAGFFVFVGAQRLPHLVRQPSHLAAERQQLQKLLVCLYLLEVLDLAVLEILVLVVLHLNKTQQQERPLKLH